MRFTKSTSKKKYRRGLFSTVCTCCTFMNVELSKKSYRGQAFGQINFINS